MLVARAPRRLPTSTNSDQAGRERLSQEGQKIRRSEQARDWGFAAASEAGRRFLVASCSRLRAIRSAVVRRRSVTGWRPIAARPGTVFRRDLRRAREGRFVDARCDARAVTVWRPKISRLLIFRPSCKKISSLVARKAGCYVVCNTWVLYKTLSRLVGLGESSGRVFRGDELRDEIHEISMRASA